MMVNTYSTDQRALHWLVVLLVTVQFVTGGGMEESFNHAAEGTDNFNGSAWVHGVLGATILLAMLARLTLRMKRGAPPPPSTEPSAIQKVSRGTHYLFYLILIAMPLIGLTAVLTLNETIAAIHGWTSLLLLALIVAHVAGAFWHMSNRDGLIKRMTAGY